jgi:ABC-2 type transport system permease protein
MSAATQPHVATRPSVAAPLALLRTCRAEWSRLWSVRSTWWFVLASAVAGLGIGALLATDAASNPGMEVPNEGAWAGGRFASMFILFGILATAVVTTTGDHVTGGIVPSLQWTPRRGILLTARTLVVVGTTSLYALLLVTLTSVLVYTVVPAFGLTLPDGAATLGGMAWVFVTGTLLAVGLGLLTRSTAGGLVLVIALVLVLPLLLGNLPFELAQRIAEVTPGMNVMHLIFEEGPEGMTITSARVTLVCWAAGAMLLGGWRLLTRDADR